MKLKALASAALIAASCVAATSAHAAFYTFTGDTTAGPTFDRPFEDFSDVSPNGLGVHYSLFSFTASLAGDYTFVTTGTYDTFVFLYEGSFNPADPTANGLMANDDLLSPPFTTSGFVATLSAGTPYYLVTAGFDNTEFGAFSTTIGGPGVISAVPEPASFGLMALGALGVACLKRRRDRETASA